MTANIKTSSNTGGLVPMLKNLFVKVGVLPFFLFISIVVFSLLSSKFFTGQNLINVARQSVYLVLASLGQMMVLISGGFDLSIGTAIALSSVATASAMVFFLNIMPEAIWLAVVFGIFVGLLVAMVVGAINGLGVAYFEVSPFIMTLGVSSVGAGVALFMTGGIPVSGLPYEFGDSFGFGRLFGVPVPVIIAVVLIVLCWFLMSRTSFGAQLYAVGGNIKAAHLSGINTKLVLFRTYVACAAIAGLTGVLLTARVESGEANLGGTMALESIAACVIAGVSLHGGIGRVGNVVLGGFFIVLMQNGMNLAQVSSYMQMVLLGMLLIMAVIFDQIRYRMIMSGNI